MIQKLLRSLIHSFKKALESTELGQRILYDIRNRGLFGNLYFHEMMIADAVRVDFYHKGIRRYIKPGDIIVDLGTGTGILSFMAAQQNPKKIYAIDHSDLIDVAKKIAEHNNINNVTFMKINSRDFSPDEKLDVILHEQIGHALFEENMVSNLLDLKKRVLKETGKILPGKFELFLEPVCLKREYRVPYIWENEIHGIDFKVLEDLKDIDKYKSVEYPSPLIEHAAVDHFLCKPEPCLSFDLNEMDDEDEIPKLIDGSKKVVNPGHMDGICLYFRAIFDEEVILDTSPLQTRTCWKNPLFRTESRYYDAGESISFRLNMEVPFKKETWSLELGPD